MPLGRRQRQAVWVPRRPAPARAAHAVHTTGRHRINAHATAAAQLALLRSSRGGRIRHVTGLGTGAQRESTADEAPAQAASRPKARQTLRQGRGTQPAVREQRNSRWRVQTAQAGTMGRGLGCLARWWASCRACPPGRGSRSPLLGCASSDRGAEPAWAGAAAIRSESAVNSLGSAAAAIEAVYLVNGRAIRGLND